MKVNDEFYQTANEKIEQLVKSLEDDIEEFKTIIDSFLGENRFGFASVAISVINEDMYSAMNGQLEKLVTNMVSCTDDFVKTINSDDSLY